MMTGQRARAERAWVLAVASALLILGACDGGGDAEFSEEPGQGEPLVVLSATSLNTVMPELVSTFQRSSGTAAEVAYGSSSNLAAQIENGAPADLFFAADEATLDRLAARGQIREGSARVYALGKLALVWREGVRAPTSLPEIGDSKYHVIAIANPELAPYGAAARELLQRLHLWSSLEPRVVLGENVAQAYQLIQTGNADVGIIALSLALESADSARFTEIDSGLYSPLRQKAGVVQSSENRQAGAFLDFVTSSEGQEILRRYGFSEPDS
jgi:molybdate transport system substrate-binding protein